ncbi:MAG: TetR/AcrR family transcriptional regulator [Acidimicrobiales bacterium]|nr:TetR/AcrR family transcriptional regulator [Acidimicrobiales bacterium]MCB1248767.1 TetR/AcrR family transcriptional regulator [Acidimicrobiales bacterium]MCB1261113.1 TetR/AcrR family transcriptional regulator [Acidimicrobiales bacterium]
MAARTPSRWSGKQPDERRRERRDLLLDTAYELLGTAGAAGTTVRGVCEAARLNPRYFYESFADLDELLVAVYDRAAVEAMTVMRDAQEAASDDPLARSRAVVGALVAHFVDDPRRPRVLYLEGLGNEALARRRMEAMRGLATGLVREAAEQQPDDGSLDPVVEITATMIVGGFAELMLRWVHGELAVPDDELVEDIAALFVAAGSAAEAIVGARTG